MNINITARGIDLTETIKQYTTEKMEMLQKYFENIQQIDVEIGKKSNHHNKGKIFYSKINVFVPNSTIRMEKDAESLYKSIDKAKDHLKVELEKMKEKRRHIDRLEIRESKEYYLED
ncbi:MAG: ribosome-associated translation inhibitor RaiA [Candidatus Magasanikbacteria bacterium]|nr:ribosome-associated translation inhibitor RaiA [Candidatus Magasanikbacteria bacterium]